MIANYEAGSQDRVLDAGFGRERRFSWQKEFGVSTYRQIFRRQSFFCPRLHCKEGATDISATAGLHSKRLRHPSKHVKLKESGLFFDKVISVDSAYHYAPRVLSFQQGKKCPALEGAFPLETSSCKRYPRKVEKALISLICSASGIPRGNLITVDAYVADSARRLSRSECVSRLSMCSRIQQVYAQA